MQALLDLLTMLRYANVCIEGGAPLRELACAQCMTAVPAHVYFEDVDAHDDGAGELVEADYYTLHDLYGEGRRLRGLDALNLSESPDSGQAAVNLLAAAAPDLRSLSLAWRGVSHGMDAVRSVMCGRLHALEVAYHVGRAGRFARRLPGSHRRLAVTLQLAEASNLSSCLFRLLGAVKAGDRVSIVMDCHAAAEISPACTRTGEGWQLALAVHVPEGSNDAFAQARISYEWVEAEGAMPAWVAAVDWQLGADSICIEDIDEALSRACARERLIHGAEEVHDECMEEDSDDDDFMDEL